MRKIAAIVPLVIFLGLILFFWSGLGLNPRALQSSRLGKPAPILAPFTQKDFLGHISLLHVWATWCETCEAEHPMFLELAPIESIKIYALDYKDNTEQAKKFLKEKGNPYSKILFDEKGQAAIEWGVNGTPETYVIDQHGVVQYKHSGPLTRSVWETEMIPLIEDLHRMDEPGA